MASLQKNVAGQNFTFCLVSTTTGLGVAGATVTVSVVKDNGAQVVGGGVVTNSGLGQYNYAPTQAETNATDVGFFFTATGCIPANVDFHPDQVDANGLLQVDVVDVNGSATIEAGMTLLQALRLIASTTGGKLSGAGTGTETFRNAVADSANRVVATVDSAGNRSAITYSL